MAKTQRVRKKIISYMKEKGEVTTTEIFDYLNDNMRHGTTMGQLGNILGKSSIFIKMDYIDELVPTNLQYDTRKRVCSWKLQDED